METGDTDPLRRTVLRSSRIVAAVGALLIAAIVLGSSAVIRHPSSQMGAALTASVVVLLLCLLLSVLRRQERFEAALAASEMRFRDFASCSADLFWETDAEDRFIYIFGKICGEAVEPSSVLGFTRWEIAERQGHCPESDPCFSAYRRLVAAREAYRDFALWTRRRNGDRIAVLISATPVFAQDGRFLGYRGTSRDVTPMALASEALKLEKEKAEAAAKARTTFLATMSHEIRNPLNGVIGLSRMLSEAPLRADHQNLAAVLRNSAEHLMQLVDDILDLSRIEAEQVVLDETPFDLRQTLQGVVDLLRPQAEAKKLAFDYTVAPDVPELMAGDPVRLRQILLNLAGNALKFTAAGKVSIAVALEQSRETDLALAFDVRDTGPGIAPEAITRLFKQYSQGSMAIARQYGGTGLGLAICRQLVGAMRGEIRVESRVGEGSAFHFTVQLRRVRVSATTLPVAAKCPPALARRDSLKVLLAEDDTVNQLVAVNLLQKLDCRVDVVTNGQAAIEAAASDGYDVVIMDMVMPEMDGLQAVRAIRALAGPGSAVPIVAMTASVAVEDRADCLAAGADHFIAKPMSLHQLADALNAVLREDEEATVSGANASDPVDIDFLTENFGEAAAELIAVFIAETEARLERMRRLRQMTDKPALEREAHSLKSAAATFGCMRLSELAGLLEEAVSAKEGRELDRAIETLGQAFDDARRRLDQAVAAMRCAA